MELTNKKKIYIYHSIIFLFTCLIMCSFGKLISQINSITTTIICLFFISTIGISHGALDYLNAPNLCKKFNVKNTSFFYIVYLLISILVIFFWLLLPEISLIIFLLTAAYHFGSEDLEMYFNYISKKTIKKIAFQLLVLFKGLLIISAPLFFNYEETLGIFNLLGSKLDLYKNGIVFIFFCSIVANIVLILLAKKSQKLLLCILLDIISILFINIFFSPLIAFSMYFCFLHSFRHSFSLIESLDSQNIKNGFNLFIIKALPLTAVTSLLFLSSIYYLSGYYVLSDSIIKTIFIGLASLTYPHIIFEKIN